MRTALWRCAVFALTGIALACSSGSESAATPTADAVLRQATQAMSALRSVSADVKFGPGITVAGVALTSASSKIQLPSDSDSLFKVKQGDFLVDLRVVTTNGHVYLKLPFSNFTELTPDQAKDIPNVSALFDPTSGLPAVLASGTGARLLGTEQIAGVDCYKVSTTYTASQLGQLLGTVKPAGDVQATIWVGRSDHNVRRVVLNGPLLEAGKVVQVEVDLHDFNKPVDIATPSPLPT